MKFCFNIYFTCVYQYELFGYFVKRGDNGIIAFILGMMTCDSSSPIQKQSLSLYPTDTWSWHWAREH